MFWFLLIFLGIPCAIIEWDKYHKQKLDEDAKQASIDIAKHLKHIAENSKNK